MLKHPEQAKLAQERIAKMLEQYYEAAQAARDEFNEQPHEELLDLHLHSYLAPFAAPIRAIAYEGYVKDPQEVSERLKRYPLVNFPMLEKHYAWYTSLGEAYPKIRHYFELGDHLRLTALEYILLYQL